MTIDLGRSTSTRKPDGLRMLKVIPRSFGRDKKSENINPGNYFALSHSLFLMAGPIRHRAGTVRTISLIRPRHKLSSSLIYTHAHDIRVVDTHIVVLVLFQNNFSYPQILKK